jgi:hypothetical protein
VCGSLGGFEMSEKVDSFCHEENREVLAYNLAFLSP